MEITGKITQVLEMQSGESANGSWQKQEFVLLEDKEQYPKTIAFEIWGDKIKAPSVGDKVNVSINIESREYNGKYYTNVKAWKVETLNAETTQEEKPEQLESDDLPF